MHSLQCIKSAQEGIPARRAATASVEPGQINMKTTSTNEWLSGLLALVLLMVATTEHETAARRAVLYLHDSVALMLHNVEMYIGCLCGQTTLLAGEL